MPGSDILLVDDDETILELFKLMLNLEGFSVETAKSSLEALEKMRSERFQVAFLDMIMPEMRGHELAKEMKKLDKDIKIIFVTGYSDFEAIEALDFEIFDILVKPISDDALYSAAKRALSKHQNQQVSTDPR